MYLIGYILKPHGIRGEVKVEPVSPYPERYKQLKTVCIRSGDKQETYSIENVRIANKVVYLKLDKIDTRDAAEKLRNSEVLIEKKELIKPSENEYFIHDLTGCQVSNDDGNLLGKVYEVVQMSSNDVLIIRNNKNNELLIPFIRDVVKKVDIENKQIIVHSLEGLIE